MGLLARYFHPTGFTSHRYALEITEETGSRLMIE